MATVCINLVTVSNVGGIAGPLVNMPVMSGAQIATETITSSGTSQATTATSTQNSRAEFWDIVVSGGNVRLAFAASPTAAADSGWLILDGERVQFGASGSGERVAVIDAS